MNNQQFLDSFCIGLDAIKFTADDGNSRMFVSIFLPESAVAALNYDCIDPNDLTFSTMKSYLQLLIKIITAIIKNNNIDKNTVVWARDYLADVTKINYLDLDKDFAKFCRKEYFSDVQYTLWINTENNTDWKKTLQQIARDYTQNYATKMKAIVSGLSKQLKDLDVQQMPLLNDAFKRSCRNVQNTITSK